MKRRQQQTTPQKEQEAPTQGGSLPSDLERLFEDHSLDPIKVAQLGGAMGNQAVQQIVGGDAPDGDGEQALGGFARATAGAGGAMPYQEEMESAFGQSFDDIRAHTGQGDALSGISARAATDGRDVAFADGSPDPELVAHEAAHIAQGTGVVAAKSLLDTPGDAAEREADAVAPAASRGEPVSVSQTPSAAVHRYGDHDEEEEETEYREMSEDELPDWEYTTASKPKEVLEDVNIHALHAYEAAQEGSGDYGVLLSQIDQLRSKYDKDGYILTDDVMTEHRGRATALRGAINKQTGLIPSTEKRDRLREEWTDGEYEYRRVGLAGWRITSEGAAERSRRMDAYNEEHDNVGDRVSDVQDALDGISLELTANKNELRDPIHELLLEEADEVGDEFNTISYGFAYLVPDANRDAYDGEMEKKNENILGLETFSEERDLTGAALKERRDAVANDRNLDGNRLKISQAIQAVRDYKHSHSAKLEALAEMLMDNGASDFYFSKGWGTFTDSISDNVNDLDKLRDRFVTDRKNPDAADGASYLAATRGAIAKIDKRIDAKGKEMIPKAKAGEALGELVRELTSLTDEHGTACYNALPAMKTAVVHKRIHDALNKLLEKATAELKKWDDDGKIWTTAESVEARQTAAEDLPRSIRAKVEPKWFSYTTDLEALRGDIKDGIKDGDYDEADLKQADTQLNLAAMMDKYDSWDELVKAAREGILQKCPPEKQEAALKHLADFEKQLDADLKKELEGLIDPDALKGMMEKLNDVNDEVGLFISEPGTKDMTNFEEKYLPKLVNKQAWKAIVGKEGWRKHLGTLKSGVGKATTGVSLLISADKILKSGDTVSMIDGSKHPGIEGLSACLDAVNTFNKVPLFGVLIDIYVVALDGISKQLAVISRQTARKRLQLAAVTGNLGSGPVMK